jgi:hypothetical protein
LDDKIIWQQLAVSTQRHATRQVREVWNLHLLLTLSGKANRFRLQTGPSDVIIFLRLGSGLDWIRREDFMAAKKRSTRAKVPTAAQLVKARKMSKAVHSATKRLELALRKYRDAVSPMWFVD